MLKHAVKYLPTWSFRPTVKSKVVGTQSCFRELACDQQHRNEYEQTWCHYLPDLEQCVMKYDETEKES